VKHKIHDEQAQKIIQQDFEEQKQELKAEMGDSALDVEAQKGPNALFKAQQSAEEAQQTLQEMAQESNSEKDLEANEEEIDTEIQGNEAGSEDQKAAEAAPEGCHNPEWHCGQCNEEAGDGNDCLTCDEGFQALKQWSDDEHQYYSCTSSDQVAMERTLRGGNTNSPEAGEEGELNQDEEERRNEWVSTNAHLMST
jgi:hypothetical protein